MILLHGSEVRGAQLWARELSAQELNSGERGLDVVASFQEFVPVTFQASHIVEGFRLPPLIANSPTKGNRLLVIIERSLPLTQRVVGQAHAIEKGCFPRAVTCRPNKRQRLIVVGERLLLVAEIVVNPADVV